MDEPTGLSIVARFAVVGRRPAREVALSLIFRFFEVLQKGLQSFILHRKTEFTCFFKNRTRFYASSSERKRACALTHATMNVNWPLAVPVNLAQLFDLSRIEFIQGNRQVVILEPKFLRKRTLLLRGQRSVFLSQAEVNDGSYSILLQLF